jgi:hypothetical protein
MFEWLKRLVWQPGGDDSRSVRDIIGEMRETSGGGNPTRCTKRLGVLPVPSRILTLGDPQEAASAVQIPRLKSPVVQIFGRLWVYPKGTVTVTGLDLRTESESHDRPNRPVGTVPIDSARIVIADKQDIDGHWSDVGKDRIGLISTLRDDKLLKLLTRRFGIRTMPSDGFHAQIVGPVSEDSEREIEHFLKSIPEYAQFPFMHFRVQTNNSFDRVNFLRENWAFLPVGNEPAPLMFACDTGYGDGSYDVRCASNLDEVTAVSITFIDEFELNEQ